MGGVKASNGKGGNSNPAVAATKSQILALPATLQFAKWLSWNATHTAKLFNKWSFTYQKTSSNAIDSFATQVQSMVKKIQGFIKMMMKYSTPEGIDQLENTLIDYAIAQMKAMLLVTNKRVRGLVKNHPIKAFAKPSPSKDVHEKIQNALDGPLSELAPNVANELRKLLEPGYDVSKGSLNKEISNLLETIGATSLATVAEAVDNHVQASFLHIEVSDDLKALHAEGKGSIDKDVMAELEKDVHIALQRAEASREELVQLESKVTDEEEEDGIIDTLAELIEDAINLLNALTHALPQASKALIFAKKE